MKTNNILKKYIFLNDENNQIVQNIDFSTNKLSEVIKTIDSQHYAKRHRNEDLHNYIFKFYAYNEILSSFREKQNGIISKDDLIIFQEYEDFINDFSKNIFCFILYSSIAELQNAHLIEKMDLIESNPNYLKAIKKAYSDKCIKDFTKGTTDEFMGKFLYELKNEDEKKYILITENTSLLKKHFDTYIKNVSCYTFPQDFQYNFDNYYENNNYKFEESFIKKMKTQFKDDKGIYNKDKFVRFTEFSKFIFSLKDIDTIGDYGSLQREIISTEMIENNIINDFSIDDILQFLSITFKEGFKENKIYGGEPWSDIAKHALSFARGEINAEIFIDQALSLEHNGGQMFNKDFVFNDCSLSSFCSLVYKEQNELQEISIDLDLNNALLGLQNSSSVLSLHKFTEINIEDLNLNLINENQKLFIENNLEVFKRFSSDISSLNEMTTLAKRVGYSIPQFDFVSLMLCVTDKQQNNFYKQIVEKNTKENNFFSQILSENFKNKNIYNELLQDKAPIFKLHNLNSNNAKELTKEMIGGKAYGLANLINKGFNVPKALVFDTETCLSYQSNKEYFHEQYASIDKKIFDYLIDNNKQPLLVSVRSGAPVSMPGMMDSILNVGIDDKTYPQLCKIYGKQVIEDCAISFMSQFCSSKIGLNIQFSNDIYKALETFSQVLENNKIPYNKENLFPLPKEQQIKYSVEAVFDSWHSPRAIAWRNEKNISHDLGTAATVQQMVFGNKNDKSLTCVIFSRDCITGKPDIMGEYLSQAQGEDLVSGKRTPLPISQLKISNPKVYQEIEFIAKTLEEEQKAIQDIEITVEDGKVYVLQMRNAVVSPEAQLALAKDMNLNLLDIVEPKSLIGEAKVDTLLKSDYNGLVGSPGLISGIIVRNQEDIDKYKNEGKDLIFFSNQALPEHAPIMIATQGFITEFGGATSHAAILARSMGKPCIVGIGRQESNHLESGSIITVDASEGKIWKGELPIVINQDKAINLANQILKDNNIEVPALLPNNDVVLKSWATKLSSFTVLTNKKINKHKMFLNIAQQTALILQREHKNYLRVSI